MNPKPTLIIIVLLLCVIALQLHRAAPRIPIGSPQSATVTEVTQEESLNIDRYKTITIGKQTWMAENLRVRVKGSYSVANSPENDPRFGRLYTWEAAVKNCPKGWRLPTRKDFIELVKNFPDEVAGKALRDGGESGFSARLSGYYDHRDQRYYGQGNFGQFWTSERYHFTDCAWLFYLDRELDEYAGFAWYSNYQDGFSVRYIKD